MDGYISWTDLVFLRPTAATITTAATKTSYLRYLAFQSVLANTGFLISPSSWEGR